MKITVDFYPHSFQVEAVIAGMLARGDKPSQIGARAVKKELQEAFSAHGQGWSCGQDIDMDEPWPDDDKAWRHVARILNKVTN